METNNSTSAGNSTGGQIGTVPQVGGFEVDSMQEVGVYPSQTENISIEPHEDIPFDPSKTNTDAREIMEIPGTPHDKLESLADSKDGQTLQNIEGEKIEPDQEKIQEAEKDEKLTPEQRIMTIQLEVMKVMADYIQNKSKDVPPPEKPKIDFEGIIKELKGMLKNLDGDGKKPKNSVMINTVMCTIALLTAFSQYKEDNN